MIVLESCKITLVDTNLLKTLPSLGSVHYLCEGVGKTRGASTKYTVYGRHLWASAEMVMMNHKGLGLAL